MRTYALVLIGAAMLAACGTDTEQNHAPLATGEWATLPREGACSSTEQALTVRDIMAEMHGKHAPKLPAWAAPKRCDEPTFLVANVGPRDDPADEFLGVAVTVTAGNCSVTVESVTFDLRLRTEDGYAVALSGPASLVASTRIATGNPAELSPGERLADALTGDLARSPCSAGPGTLAWCTYDPVAVPVGQSRVIGLFAELGSAAPSTYLFSVVGGSAVFSTGARTGLRGPLFGLPFRVTEPPPVVCKQPFVSVWPLAPEDNTFGVSRKLVAEVFAPDCDLHLTRLDVSFRRVNDVEGYGGEQWAFFSWDHLSHAQTVDVTVGLDSDTEYWGLRYESTEGLSGAVIRTTSDWTGFHVPAGDIAIFEVTTSLDADILPGEYLMAVERVEGTVLDTDDDVQLYGLPAYGIPFTISE